MSTSHRIHEAGPKNYGNPEQEVSICERSARFDLDLYGYPPDGDTAGPQQMSAGEARQGERDSGIDELRPHPRCLEQDHPKASSYVVTTNLLLT
jgi:hypothetical protein